MNKMLLIAIVGLVTALLVSPSVAGSITIVRSGASVDEFVDGDNHSLEDSIYDDGILLGDGFGKATPVYRILLPPPNYGGNQITSITVSIEGNDAWLSNPYVEIGTPAQVDESIGDGEYVWFFTGSNARNLLDAVGDGLGYTLDVKIKVGGWTDQYDLKEITVTYEYSNVSSDVLEKFEQAYAAYRTLKEYEYGMVDTLWNTGTWSSEYFYQAVQESLAFADNLSSLSGSLYSSLKSTINCIENFQNLGGILGSAFDYTLFWIYYEGPSKSTVSDKLIDARDAFQIYTQRLRDYAFDGDISTSDATQLNSSIDIARTETTELRQTMWDVSRHSWYVYRSHGSSDGKTTAQLMLYSTAPLLNVEYDESYRTSEPSYLTGLIGKLTNVSSSDTTPPTPSPMNWNTEPYETSTSLISMMATTASDSSTPISYYFDCYSSPTGGSGGSDSGWQSSTSYSDSGLSTNHQYGYRVKAKDNNGNETSYSSPVSYDYTDIETPSGISFGTVTNTSVQVKSSNTPSGLTRGSSGLYIWASTGQSSGWKQNNNYWTCSNLTPNYDTGFIIKARNGNGNETGYCTTVYKYTLANQPGSSSLSNITTNSIQVNWTSNGNYYYTDYYCENTITGQNSGWINNTYAWNCTGLSSGTNYSFRVKAKNSDGIETSWSNLGSQMTNYAPVINSISPDSGPAGTYIKIEGQYFYNSGSVKFSGGIDGEILSWTDTVIHCRIPSGVQTGNLVVNCPNSDSNSKFFTITEPNVIYVDDNYTPNIENGTLQYPFSEIQRGIYSSTLFDDVVVYPGTYYENINFNGKNINLTSLDPNDPNIVDATIIDGGQNDAVVKLINGEDVNCVLAGFSITNGYGNYGGGVRCEDSSPKIVNCSIFENTAKYHGGGICSRGSTGIEIIDCNISNNISEAVAGGVECYYGSSKISNCTISNNISANAGGGITVAFNDNSLIDNCVLSYNQSGTIGGGIAVLDCNATISNCIIFSNQSQNKGGGINVSWSSPNILDNIIEDNFSSFGGGLSVTSVSISIVEDWDPSPVILNNIIQNNTAIFAGGGVYTDSNTTPLIYSSYIINNYNSGIYSYNASPTINNNIIAGNEGFLSGGIACDANSTVTINNNTIVENWGQDSGGIGLDAGSSATVTNSIIWDNFTDNNENQISLFYDEYFAKQTVLDINNSDIEHGFENIYLQDSNCILTWGNNNISSTPFFIETGLWDFNDIWWEGDYHLLSNSPCIDTGDPNYPEDSNEFDIDGDSRIMGGRIDIGADEYTFGELSDFSGNGIVNFEDFSILAYYWQDYLCEEPDWCEGCDYNQSGVVDSNDLIRFAENWLWQSISY